jgi:hypothetical protein
MCTECIKEEKRKHAQMLRESSPANLDDKTLYRRAPASVADKLTPMQYTKAIVFGLIAAVIGAFIWDKFVYYTQLQFGFIVVGIAVLVGYAVTLGSEGNYNIMISVIGAVLGAGAIMLGNALVLQDVLVQGGGLPRFASTLMNAFSYRLSNMDIMDLVFVAIGAWEGWVIPARQVRLRRF